MEKAQLIELMKKLLANTVAFSIKAQNYHWNVTGPNFAQYHDFFGSIYEEVSGSVDVTAEEIRKLGAITPGSLGRYSQLADINDEDSVPQAAVMFARLAQDNDLILKNLYEARTVADGVNAAGTLDYLESRISVHEKHAWMLKAFNQ